MAIQEVQVRSIQVRDKADKAGAIIGTLGRITLATYFVASGGLSSHLIINGNNYGAEVTFKAVSYLLTVGLCANLGRHGAIGIHDTCILAKYLFDKTTQNTHKVYKKLFGNRQAQPPPEAPAEPPV